MSSIKIPGVVGCSRLLNTSDALMYNLFENDRAPTPLLVVNHGILGTQNVNSAEVGESATSAAAVSRDVANPQMTHSAKTDPEAIGMLLKFFIIPIAYHHSISVCAPSKSGKVDDVTTFKKAVLDFMNDGLDVESKKLVLARIVRNISNGRFLWRNRQTARKIEVSVNIRKGDEALETVNLGSSFDHKLSEMPDSLTEFSPSEIRLAEMMMSCVDGQGDPLSFGVEARVYFGGKGSFEVYPSQNYLYDKDRVYKNGESSRLLYSVPCALATALNETIKNKPYIGQAALRDQKVSNALKTIDTWYPVANGSTALPIPVEPMGANIESKLFYRADSNSNLFKLLPKIAGGDLSLAQKQFVYACFIRGGVFGAEESSEAKEGSQKPIAKGKGKAKPEAPEQLNLEDA